MEVVSSRVMAHCVAVPSAVISSSANAGFRAGRSRSFYSRFVPQSADVSRGLGGHGCGGSSLRISQFLGVSSNSSPSEYSKVLGKKSLGVRAAMGVDNVVTEPATSIKFAATLTAPDSSTELSFLGAGVREKNIAFVKVKVYAVGVYAEAALSDSLAPWNGKSAADLAKDESFYKELAEAPVEKALRVVLARDVGGSTFWGALNEALVPRLKAANAGADGDDALVALGKVFQKLALNKGFVIILTWVQPSSLQIGLAENGTATPTKVSSIESKALASALFDVFLGPQSVSSSARTEVADGINKLLMGAL